RVRRLNGNILRSEGSVCDPAVIQRLAPEGVEIRTCVLLLPVLLHKVMTAETRLASKHGDDFVGAFSAVKRLNQRLYDGGSAVISAGIAPRLKVVRFRDVPVAQFRSLIAMRAEVNLRGDRIRLQGCREFEIGRSVIGRIAAQDQQQIDFSSANILDKL